jgi:outer membrane protein TolC
MKHKHKFRVTVFFKILLFLFIFIQNTDAQTVFTIEEFMNVVRQYHPMAKQANLWLQQGKAEVLSARGGFDPLLYLNSEQKTFDGKNYYSYVNPELKIPTWYGIEIKAGLEDNTGRFLDAETTSGQSSYLGLSMPLVKNLLMDKRRAVLQQAKILEKASFSEKQLMLNDLYYDAYKAYLEWAMAEEILQVRQNMVRNSAARLRYIRTTVTQGERMAIDTTEALSQLQNFSYEASQALLQRQKAVFDLANYLWLEAGTPYLLPDAIKPQTVLVPVLPERQPVLNTLLQGVNNHPKLKLYDFKLQGLEVERKLKFQSMLPTVNLNTVFLSKGYNLLSGIEAPFFQNNYKFGFQIGLPLRFSEGRGEYQKNKIKVLDTGFEQAMKRNELENKVRGYFTEYEQYTIQEKVINSYTGNLQRLLNAEETRLQIGEGTLFLINSREIKVQEAQEKLIEIRTKIQKARVALQWAVGGLE